MASKQLLFRKGVWRWITWCASVNRTRYEICLISSFQANGHTFISSLFYVSLYLVYISLIKFKMHTWNYLETNSDLRRFRHSVGSLEWGIQAQNLCPRVWSPFICPWEWITAKKDKSKTLQKALTHQLLQLHRFLLPLPPFRFFPWALRPLRSAWTVFHYAGLPKRLGVALSPSCRLELVFQHQGSPHCQTGKGWRKT